MHGDIISITDVCDFQGGSQPPKNEWSESPKNGYIRMLQIRDFTQGKKEHIAYVKKSNKIRECIESDVLIGRYGASVGKILTGLAGAYNVAIMKTVPNTDKLDTRFLYFLLKSPHFQNFILNVGVRAAQAGFSKKDLKKYKFFLPQDINDQIKIANLLTQVETLITKREESIELLDELLKSTFLDMFGDPVNNPKGFEGIQLQDVCLDKGEYGSGASAIEYDASLPRYLRITDINDDGSLSNEKKAPDELESKYFLEYGDMLFARTGATVGKTYLHTSDELLQFAGYLIRFKPDFELINPYYLFHFTQSGYYRYWVSKKQRAAGQPNINAKEYGTLKLLKPPKPLQDKFATIVQQVEATKAHYQDSLDELNELFGSLSQRAFKGELDLSEMKLVKETTKAINTTTEKVYVAKDISVISQTKTITIDDVISKLFDKNNSYDQQSMDGFSFEEIKRKLFEYLDQNKYKQKFFNEQIEINKK